MGGDIMSAHGNVPLVCFVSIFLGYLIGSISPAFFFSRVKEVDLRRTGTGNVGTLNLYHSIGLGPTIPTAVFDTIKGVLAIVLAQSMGASFVCAQLSGFVAVIGHVFPFYLRFRGGQGVATATGILVYYIIKHVRAELSFLYILGFLLIIVAILCYVTKKGELVGMIVLPLLCYAVLIGSPGFAYNIYLVIIALYIVAIGIRNTAKFKLMQIHDETFKSHWWRIILRPCATIFIVLYLYWPQRQVLIFVGSVALVFILLDVVRFVVRAANELFTVRIKSFFKKGESRRFSSMTMFLFASFIIVLLFKKDIAIAALAYLIFGDIFAKIYGLAFGRRKLFDKTIEGSLAYLGGALICAYVLHTTLLIPILILAIGAVAATIAEFMPLGLDDNFTVGIFSGAVMTVVRTFGS
jgi:glycerol-3-phosphate acyltransferase PlsY